MTAYFFSCASSQKEIEIKSSEMTLFHCYLCSKVTKKQCHFMGISFAKTHMKTKIKVIQATLYIKLNSQGHR